MSFFSVKSSKRLQRLFLGGMLLFLAFLVVGVITRSRERRSLVVGVGAVDQAEEVLETMRSPVKDSSEFHLQDFHRVEVKDGRPIWEVRAKDAKYYSDEQLAHVSDAKVVVHRERDASLRFEAKAGKLFLTEEELTRAEMEGDITVSVDEQISIRTDVADYDAKGGVITAPGAVAIKGEGYAITGEGMKASIDDQVVVLQANVESIFETERDGELVLAQ